MLLCMLCCSLWGFRLDSSASKPRGFPVVQSLGFQFLLLSGFGSVSISPEKRLLDSDSAYCVGIGSLRPWDIRVPNKYQYYYSGLLLTHGPHGSSFFGVSYLQSYKVIPKRNYYGAYG